MKTRFFFLFIFVIIAGCYEVTVFNGVPIRQYASEVIDFSSQYSSGDWAANKALGPFDVYPNFDDDVYAWASQTQDDQREFLVLGFAEPQTVSRIQIYETLYPGSVDTVYLRDSETNKWKKVYSRPAVAGLPDSARIFNIFQEETKYLADAIRIAINSPAVGGWNEIDAVAITGQKAK